MQINKSTNENRGRVSAHRRRSSASTYSQCNGQSCERWQMLSHRLEVEAAVVAQKIHGTSKITPAMYRDGMEAVDLSAERMAELGFKDFAPPFKNSCENHGGSGLAAVQQWDAKAKKWSLITEYMYGDKSITEKLIAEDSAKYAAEQKIAERCN